MPTIIHHPDQIDFDRPGKHDYQVAFHLDSGWGYPWSLTIINGAAPASPAPILQASQLRRNARERMGGSGRGQTALPAARRR